MQQYRTELRIGASAAAGLVLVACAGESADQVEEESIRLHREVSSIIQRSCSSSRCHGGIIPGGRLVFGRHQDMRRVLVNVPACEYELMPRVMPGAPEMSWLVVKLTSEVYDTPERAGWIRFQPDPRFSSPANECGFVAPDGTSLFGQRMPATAPNKLEPAEIAVITRWIALGAGGP